LKKYEALLIFEQQMEDAVLEEKIDKVKNEITRLDGKVESATRVGRIAFARRLKKKDAGTYAVVVFAIEPLKIGSLTEKLHLNEDLFRFQITVFHKKQKDVRSEAS
jgi:ribosomal protein S6